MPALDEANCCLTGGVAAELWDDCGCGVFFGLKRIAHHSATANE
jgi:hypothetical protein